MQGQPVTSSSTRTSAVVATPTASRVTPSDGPTFGEVMRGSAASILRGATAAVRVLPTGPVVAASVRPGAPIVTVGGLGPSAGPDMRGPGAAEGAMGTGSVGSASGGEPGVEDALTRSQDMNMYLIELQERVAAQNRAFTTYSNVLKAQHDTVKNAINNIR